MQNLLIATFSFDDDLPGNQCFVSVFVVPWSPATTTAPMDCCNADGDQLGDQCFVFVFVVPRSPATTTAPMDCRIVDDYLLGDQCFIHLSGRCLRRHASYTVSCKYQFYGEL